MFITGRRAYVIVDEVVKALLRVLERLHGSVPLAFARRCLAAAGAAECVSVRALVLRLAAGASRARGAKRRSGSGERKPPTRES